MAIYVGEIHLSNVRQFESRSFEFQHGFNLLVGENGAGKTTLLRSLLAVLGGSRPRQQPPLVDEDIRLRTPELHVSAQIVGVEGKSVGSPTYVRRLGRRAKHKGAQFVPLVLWYGSNEATCSSFVSRRVKQYSIHVGDEEDSERWLYQQQSRPALGDDSQPRFGRSEEIQEFLHQILSSFSPRFREFTWSFEPFGCTLHLLKETPAAVELPALFRRSFESLIMRHLQESGNPFGSVDKASVLIDSNGFLIGSKERKPIVPHFSDVLKELGASAPSVNLGDCSVEVRLTPRIRIKVGARESLLLSQLSDGEQRLFSLFVDIARQLSLETPDRASFRRTSAVVLIDEIDVHLHPKWQRMIVPALEELFPTCQFIATTHSPFVIQSLSRGGLIRLIGERSDSPDYHDQSIEDIVEDIQGIDVPQRSKRDEKMSRASEAYFTLLMQGKDAPKDKLTAAELAYRLASEPFTSQPGLNALLKLEAISARTR